MSTSADCPDALTGKPFKATANLARERFMERIRWHLEEHAVRYVRFPFPREGVAVMYFGTEADRDLYLAAVNAETLP